MSLVVVITNPNLIIVAVSVLYIKDAHGQPELSHVDRFLLPLLKSLAPVIPLLPNSTGAPYKFPQRDLLLTGPSHWELLVWNTPLGLFHHRPQSIPVLNGSSLILLAQAAAIYCLTGGYSPGNESAIQDHGPSALRRRRTFPAFSINFGCWPSQPHLSANLRRQISLTSLI